MDHFVDTPPRHPVPSERDTIDARARIVRHFNRFYTRQIGVLHEHLLDSEFSLTEVRILYELAHRAGVTAADLARELGLDPGYISRVISAFERRGLVEKRRSADDARISNLVLTDAGREVFTPLEAAAQAEVVQMLRALAVTDQQRLTEAMQTIERLLAGGERSFVLRPHRPGDMGWIVHRHGVLYAQEYGWDEQLEAFVADVVAKFVRNFDPKSERCWIAEKDQQPVGSIFVVRHSDTTAQLRLLYVEPSARGLGIGNRLVDEGIRFARQAGYKKIFLWTNSVLTTARRIYKKSGFELVAEEPHHSFGHDLVGETWEREL
jgi:DNA-binding MarR family transcriptional regulator/GNAT superfamily N-acetyltransferase